MHLGAQEPFKTEAEMVSCWLAELKASVARTSEAWTVYPETAGWDLLLVHRDGYQLGLEAKLVLNAKVIAQALDGQHRYWSEEGPDFRGILVPSGKVQRDLGPIATAVGLGIMTVHRPQRGVRYALGLPAESDYSPDWPHWVPTKRCTLPDYIPDVAAGVSSPVQLTQWKVKAIQLMIILERRGYVGRADMRALKISPSRWTDHWQGFLDRGPVGYVRGERTPDLKAQHPRNYAEIEADFDKWAKPLGITTDPEPTAAELFAK